MQYPEKDLQGEARPKDLQVKASSNQITEGSLCEMYSGKDLQSGAGSKDLQLKASSKDLQTKANQAEQQERMGKQYGALRMLFRYVDHRKAELGSAMIFATKYIRQYCTAHDALRQYCTAHDALGPELTTSNPYVTIGIEGCKLNQLTLLYDLMSHCKRLQMDLRYAEVFARLRKDMKTARLSSNSPWISRTSDRIIESFRLADMDDKYAPRVRVSYDKVRARW